MRTTKSLGYRLAVVATMTAVLVGAGAMPALAAGNPYKISISDVTVTEGNTGSVSATFTISYGGPNHASTVNWATADQTATAGSDYTASSGTASLPPRGCKCATVTVPVLGDLLDEGNETFVVNLSNPSRGWIQDGQGTGTILDDDAMPSASVADVSVDENAGPLTFTVQLSNPSASTVTVAYATSNGSATAGSDYTATSGTLTFVSSDVSETVAVTLLDDALDESNETVNLTLSSPVNATIARGTAVGTIVDDDPPPTLSIGDASVSEPAAGTATASFTVSLSKPHPTTVTVGYATMNGSARAGADYTATSGTLTFVAGDTSETVDVTVLADLLAEDDETFDVVLSGPTPGIPVTDGTGVGTIIDDGDPNPAISIGDASAGEGGSLTFTVTLDTPAGRTVTVDYATADGSALAGSDYTAATGTLTFVAGDTSQTITIATTADPTYENDEDLSISLSAPTNATIADGTAVGTILNDDALPTFSVNDISVNEADGTATFTVTKTGATAFGATVDVATANVTATAGADYVAHADPLTFAAGVSTIQVDVTLLDDLVHDGTEFFTLELSTPSGATIADASGTATITDDETPPTISIDDVTTAEGDAGTTTATFTVTLTGPTIADAIIDYTVVGGTATTGVDVEVASGSVTVPVGDTTATIEVDVEGDVIYEGDEDYRVELSNPFSVAITDVTGDGTITDDDPIPSIAIDDITVAEGTGGTTAAIFTVTRTGETELPITFDVTTADDTAAAGSDYQALAGSRTLAVGTASRTVTVNVMADAVDEDDETFDLAIANPGGATISDASGVATIIDDDKAVSSLTVKARKTATKVRARGILEPATGTSKVKVVLQKKVKTRWKAVASKRVGVTQIRDRDGDGYDDAMYRATLKRPAPGKYRFVVRTGATADATPALRTKAFRV